MSAVTHTHSRAHTHTNTHAHAHTHAHTRTHTHTHMHTHIHTRRGGAVGHKAAQVRACLLLHTLTITRAHTHTQTRTYTHTEAVELAKKLRKLVSAAVCADRKVSVELAKDEVSLPPPPRAHTHTHALSHTFTLIPVLLCRVSLTRALSCVLSHYSICVCAYICMYTYMFTFIYTHSMMYM